MFFVNMLKLVITMNEKNYANNYMVTVIRGVTHLEYFGYCLQMADSVRIVDNQETKSLHSNKHHGHVHKGLVTDFYHTFILIDVESF